MVGAVLGGLGGSLFSGGGNGRREDFSGMPTQLQVTTPGYNLRSITSDNLSSIKTYLTQNPTLVNQSFNERFPRILSNLDTLRSGIAPGFSDLRAARRRQIENARSQAIGNLRDAFAQRRLSGSSFALDKIVQAEKEFGQAQAQSDAEAFLQELAANQEVLGLESTQLADAMNRELKAFGIAQGSNIDLANLISQNVNAGNQLAAKESQAAGQGLGSILGLGLSLATGGIGGTSLLGGLGSVFTGSGINPSAPSPIILSPGGGFNNMFGRV